MMIEGTAMQTSSSQIFRLPSAVFGKSRDVGRSLSQIIANCVYAIKAGGEMRECFATRSDLAIVKSLHPNDLGTLKHPWHI
jgi:hypothetical protein